MIMRQENSAITHLVMQSVSENVNDLNDYDVIDDTSDDDSHNIPTFKDYINKYNSENADKLLHTISHVKLEGSDVVIYQRNPYNRFFGGDLTGTVSVNKEILRIPKSEVIRLLQELYTKED